MQLRIGVLATHLMGWGGGIDLLRVILAGLTLDGRYDLYLLVPDNSVLALLRRGASLGKRALIDGITWKHFTRASFFIDEGALFDGLGSYGKIPIIHYGQTEASLQRALTREKIDVLMPSGLALGKAVQTPWIGYLPDFQFKYLPEYFSEAALTMRETHSGNMLQRAKIILVNAKTVARDVAQFYPQTMTRVFVMPFAPILDTRWMSADASNLDKLYKLPQRFFIISNQFWKHKDHATAFRAFGLLNARYGHSDVELVCTGKMEDGRHPNYIMELNTLIDTLGIRSRLRLLGHIPKAHQVQTMSRAIALVQPTLFEGGPGGGAAYDSVALGVPGLLSDIPVNREISEPIVQFFRSGDADALAHLMAGSLMKPHIRSSAADLSTAMNQRLRKLADVLDEAIACAVGSI